MTRDTLFRIASMTKPVTSVAALMLMEEGKLKLDDPITKWLPEFAGHAGAEGRHRPARRDLSRAARHHRRGPDDPPRGPGLRLHLGRPDRPGPRGRAGPAARHAADARRLADRRWATLPLSYPPGERFHYSHATEVLGFLVGPDRGQAAGRGPAGRASSGRSAWTTPTSGVRRKSATGWPSSTGSIRRPTGCRTSPSRTPTRRRPSSGGGGGLISTADDYLKFARMMLGKGEVDGVRLVKAETVEMMTRNRLTDAQRADPVHGHPVLAGPGLRPRRLGDHRPGEAGLDGRGLRGRVRLAGRLRHLVAGRSGAGHGADLPDPELHAAGPRRGRATGRPASGWAAAPPCRCSRRWSTPRSANSRGGRLRVSAAQSVARRARSARCAATHIGWPWYMAPTRLPWLTAAWRAFS